MPTHAILIALSAALPIAPAVPPQDGEEDVAAIVAECVKQMNDDDWEVRDKGEARLLEVGRKAIAPLRKLIKEKGDSFPRKDLVVEALQDLEMDWAESVIKKLFTDEGNAGSFDGQCKPVLEELGDEAEGVLLTLVKSPVKTSRVREIAAQALGDLGKASSIGGLKEVWNDEYETESVRAAAAFAMDTLGDSAAFDALVKQATANLEACQKGDEKVGDEVHVAAIRAMVDIHRHKKEHEKVLSLYERLGKIRPDDPGVDYNTACTLALMGKTKEALDSLERAVEKGYAGYKWMSMDGDLDTLRSDDRFKALFEKAKKAGGG